MDDILYFLALVAGFAAVGFLVYSRRRRSELMLRADDQPEEGEDSNRPQEGGPL